MPTRGQLVTFGIVPGFAETGYGYVRRGDVVPGATGCGGFLRWRSSLRSRGWKPLRGLTSPAATLLRNSGMFRSSAGRHYLEELEKFRPEIFCRL